MLSLGIDAKEEEIDFLLEIRIAVFLLKFSNRSLPLHKIKIHQLLVTY